MTTWTTHLPDDERAAFVESVCRLVEECSGTGDMEPLVRVVQGWQAAAEVHSNPSLRAVIGAEHVGPPVPIVRPFATPEPAP